MAVINNLPQFHAAMAALAPIDGVAADGHIFFQPTATSAQIAAANAAAASYTDVAPQFLPLATLLARLTDTEYQAVVTLAGTNAQLHRAIYGLSQIDLSLPVTQSLVTAMITATSMAAARQAVVFAAPPKPSATPTATLPPMVSVSGPPAVGG